MNVTAKLSTIKLKDIQLPLPSLNHRKPEPEYVKAYYEAMLHRNGWGGFPPLSVEKHNNEYHIIDGLMRYKAMIEFVKSGIKDTSDTYDYDVDVHIYKVVNPVVSKLLSVNINDKHGLKLIGINRNAAAIDIINKTNLANGKKMNSKNLRLYKTSLSNDIDVQSAFSSTARTIRSILDRGVMVDTTTRPSNNSEIQAVSNSIKATLEYKEVKGSAPVVDSQGHDIVMTYQEWEDHIVYDTAMGVTMLANLTMKIVNRHLANPTTGWITSSGKATLITLQHLLNTQMKNI